MVQTTFSKDFNPDRNPGFFKICPSCGTKVPVNLVGCWKCGEILDPRIKRLKEAGK